jgi:tape measure domain-containing protein|nr:MAG TPA: tail tape measure [Caudoviricetes sp.]
MSEVIKMAASGFEVGKAYVTIIPSMEGAQSKISEGLTGASKTAGEKAGQDAGGGFKSGLSKGTAAIAGVVGSLASKAFDAIANLGGEMIETADSSQKFASTLSFAGLDDSKIKSLTESTQKYADQTVYGLSDVRNVTAQLAANGVANYDSLVEAAGNLNAVAGGSADSFKSVGLVLTQTAGAGKLTTENWNQLADAIPGASGMLQEAMKKNGAYTGDFREAMANGEITADEFNQAIQDLGFTDAAKEAATSTSTIEGAMGNLQAAIVGAGSAAIDAITPTVTSVISGVANGISSGVAAVQSFAGKVQDLLNQVVQTPVFQSIKTTIESVGTAFQNAFTRAQEAFNSVFGGGGGFDLSSLLTPITEILNQLKPKIDEVAGGISGFLNGIDFNAIATAIKLVADAVGQVVGAWLQMNIQESQSAFTVIGDILQFIGGVIQQYIVPFVVNNLPIFINYAKSIANVLKGVFGFVSKFVSAMMPGLMAGLEQIETAAQPLIQVIMDIAQWIVSNIYPLLTELFNFIGANLPAIGAVVGTIVGTIFQVVGTLIAGIISSVARLLNIIGGFIGQIPVFFTNAVNWVKGIFNKLVDFFKSAVNNIGNVFKGIADAISAPFKAAFNAIRRLWNNTIGGFGFTVPDWLPGVGGKKFTIPKLATGGTLTTGGTVMVGEAGPELLTLPRGARVTPLDAPGVGTAGGTTYNLAFGDVNLTDKVAAQQAAREFIEYLIRISS